MSVNIFKIGKKWLFKKYLDEKVFKELSDYYSDKNYRFEFYTKTNLEEAKKKLENHGYETKIIEDVAPYCVVKGKYQERKEILKKSIYHETKGDVVVFVMKDKAAVEEATNLGAEPITETDYRPLI